MTEEEKLRIKYDNLELLEKRSEKFYFNLKYLFKINLVWDDMMVMFIKCMNGK
jgi:hypothetical protein